MKIYCCQLDTVWENKSASHAKARALLKGASLVPGSLVLLPEMFSTGFSMNVATVAEGKDRESEKFLSRAAQEFGVFLLGGVVTMTKGGRGLNQAVLFGPDGREAARYSKVQPFTLGGEAQHYEAGTEIVTFAWQEFAVAPFVCYDLRFPELFRAAARRGAQLLVVIANWPIARIHHWVTLLQARAVENQAYVAGVNRCGDDPKLKYNGRSLIVSHRGDILADAGDGAKVISADVDLAELKAYRAELPFLQDMRPDFVPTAAGAKTVSKPTRGA